MGRIKGQCVPPSVPLASRLPNHRWNSRLGRASYCLHSEREITENHTFSQKYTLLQSAQAVCEDREGMVGETHTSNWECWLCLQSRLAVIRERQHPLLGLLPETAENSQVAQKHQLNWPMHSDQLILEGVIPNPLNQLEPWQKWTVAWWLSRQRTDTPFIPLTPALDLALLLCSYTGNQPCELTWEENLLFEFYFFLSSQIHAQPPWLLRYMSTCESTAGWVDAPESLIWCCWMETIFWVNQAH